MTFIMFSKLWQNNSYLVLIQSNLSEFMFLILLLGLSTDKGSTMTFAKSDPSALPSHRPHSKARKPMFLQAANLFHTEVCGIRAPGS